MRPVEDSDIDTVVATTIVVVCCVVEEKRRGEGRPHRYSHKYTLLRVVLLV